MFLYLILCTFYQKLITWYSKLWNFKLFKSGDLPSLIHAQLKKDLLALLVTEEFKAIQIWRLVIVMLEYGYTITRHR